MSSPRPNAKSPSSPKGLAGSQPKQSTGAKQRQSSTSPTRQQPPASDRLTLKNGCPLGNKFSSLLLGPYGPNLLADTAYIEEQAHLNRERIPERVAHAKGAAAFGEFVVTDASEIGKFCKASVFASKGKKTPVVVRFSHVVGESGVADTCRDIRGFAVKMYTEQGNWDLVGNNLPVFFVRDPINFASLLHVFKRDPKTHFKNPDSFWDFMGENPESLHALMMLFGERGLPDGFRHMHGYGVHAFKLINDKGQASFAKFHWICQQAIRNLEPAMADIVTGIDPDYSLRDLYTNIENGNVPSWVLKFQVMSLEEASKLDFNPFDVTKTWPHARFPLKEIGKMTLNKNPDNYFQQVEQLAFSPGNMVPGIEASPDRMLMGRMLSYPDAARYRMGINYNDLPVNKPRCPVMTPTYCDGSMNTSNPLGQVPNYAPNNKMSKVAKSADANYLEHPQEFSGKVGRFDLSKDDNYTQPKTLVGKVMSAEARQKLAAALGSFMAAVKSQDTVKKVLEQFAQIDAGLAKDVELAIAKSKQAPRTMP